MLHDQFLTLNYRVSQVVPYFRQDFVNELIARGLRQENIREIALWTQMKLEDLFRL